MKVCFAEQMRAMDRMASEQGGIPSVVLMENAAFACVSALKDTFGELMKKRIAIFCGKGNNGGDGFAIARHLYNSGVEVVVFLVCGDEFRGDALINFDIIDKMGVPVEPVYHPDVLDSVIPAYDIVIDAIYGTGVHGEIQGESRDVIEKINAFSRYTLSVDVPSGMDSNTGDVCGVCIRADMTVTFAAYKIGMFLYPGADYTGVIRLDRISIPDTILEHAETAAEVWDDSLFAQNFPQRKNDSQKGDYGKVLIIGGSEGMSGAVYLAGTAALHSGAGLVTLAAPECIHAVLETKTTEIMTVPMRRNGGHLSALSVPELLERAEKADAILIGPGMGRHEDGRIILEELLQHAKATVVVDADALNVLSENMNILEKCTCSLIFTPHEVEMARLTGLPLQTIRENRLSVSKEFCEKYGVTLILKGHHTIVTAPDGLQYINNTGNAGLAKGGSGDVLAGITAAFAARGIEEPKAAAMAAYLHGKSGDEVMRRNGIEAVTASAVAEETGKTIEKICGEKYAKYYR